jgi:uncharacterized protein (TIGR02757 family)
MGNCSYMGFQLSKSPSLSAKKRSVLHFESARRRTMAVLAPEFEALVARQQRAVRIAFDPVEIPRRYHHAPDIELSGLITAAFAYGRPVAFKRAIDLLLKPLGARPSEALQNASRRDVFDLTHGFAYRFHRQPDAAILLLAIQAAQRELATLETLYLSGQGPAHSALSTVHQFSRNLLALVDTAQVQKALGPAKGLAHLLPTHVNGASKRMNLFLRWMVRGPDAVDLGIWKRVKPAQLYIPLDTHVIRLSQWLGLTRLKSPGARMVEDVTHALRLLSAEDPLRFDFALCHFGMSGDCPSTPRRDNCRQCMFRKHCRVGKRV